MNSADGTFSKIAQLKSVESFRTRLAELGLDLPVDDDIESAASGSPLAQPARIGPFPIGNRWCIQPMEGWDAQPDGSPSELTLRRWRNFGLSGAKLIWGGEAAAVRPDGRANPHQTLAVPENVGGLAALRDALVVAHRERFGQTDDLVIGLQLTHSGRFCRPAAGPLQPRIAYHHPLLDKKFGIDPRDDGVVWTDDELDQLVEDYLTAAGLAREVGFHFVDVKACHGYLLHEFLSARSRPGRYGGDLAGRTRLLTEIIQRLRAAYPELGVAVRMSVFDGPPYQTGTGLGVPMDFDRPYAFAFGANPDNPLEYDLTEPLQLIGRLVEQGVVAINVSCGSPYYNPHIQRPAAFPPSDGYQPPEDPLIGVVRQIHAARDCKVAFPDVPMVGTGYSYLQDYLPHVAQAVVRAGWIDFVGLGRMALSYPELPHDSLTANPLARKRICRTFSDCTTGPRNGLVSGCFPLDPVYKTHPHASRLREAKQARKA